jgi:hypothetical protein
LCHHVDISSSQFAPYQQRWHYRGGRRKQQLVKVIYG